MMKPLEFQYQKCNRANMKLIKDIYNKLFRNIEPEPSISEQLRALANIVIDERVSKLELARQKLKRAKLDFQINQQMVWGK